jgi:carbon storage regulator CsrA
MLVMTRPVGQGLYVEIEEGGTKIAFKILGIRGNQVRVGIEAPQSVKVVRADAMEAEPKEALRA